MCEITVVTSGRGGAGKTMIASNLAAVLAMKGLRVLLIDMNAGLRNLDICLGKENQVIFDLGDVVNGICSIGKALVRDERFEMLYLLSAPHNRDKADTGPELMKRLCSRLRKKFDHIIIDAPDGTGIDWKAAVAPADSAVLVLTQEYASVRAAGAVDIKLLEEGIKKRCCIINRMSRKHAVSSYFPSVEEIAGEMRPEIAGIVQDDENIHIAMNRGVPVVCKNDTYIRRNFEKIVERIFG